MTTTNIAILKVLSSYPERRASFAALQSDLAMLSTREWLARMRALSELAGPVKLLSDKLAIRDANGWAITQAGCDLLVQIEHRAQVLADKPELTVISSGPTQSDSRPLRAALLRLAV